MRKNYLIAVCASMFLGGCVVTSPYYPAYTPVPYVTPSYVVPSPVYVAPVYPRMQLTYPPYFRPPGSVCCYRY